MDGGIGRHNTVEYKEVKVRVTLSEVENEGRVEFARSAQLQTLGGKGLAEREAPHWTLSLFSPSGLQASSACHKMQQDGCFLSQRRRARCSP